MPTKLRKKRNRNQSQYRLSKRLRVDTRATSLPGDAPPGDVAVLDEHRVGRMDRICASCGAAYFNVSGKVVAFHIESIDDGEEISSYNSDRSHPSFSVGLVLCRLPNFRNWYNHNVGSDIGKNLI